MSSELKLRRGSTAAHSTFTGADGEVTLDTDKNVVVSHDGITLGGFPHTKAVDLAASSGASLVGYLPTGAGAVATTVQAKLRESVSVTDFGAVGDGVTDDTAAIKLATEAVGVTGSVIFPAGIYKIVSGAYYFITCGRMVFERGAILTPAPYSEFIIDAEIEAGNGQCFDVGKLVYVCDCDTGSTALRTWGYGFEASDAGKAVQLRYGGALTGAAPVPLFIQNRLPFNTTITGYTSDSQVTLAAGPTNAIRQDYVINGVYSFINAGIVIVGNGTVEFTTKVGHINVKWFGATGDGATDDAVAINKAFQSVGRRYGGTEFHFPDGAYVIGRELKLDTGNCTLSCNPNRVTIFRKASVALERMNQLTLVWRGRYGGGGPTKAAEYWTFTGFSGSVSAPYWGGDWYIVEGFTTDGFILDGNKTNQPVLAVGTGLDSWDAGVSMLYMKKAQFHRCQFVNHLRWGVAYSTQSHDGIVDGCRFELCDEGGIYAEVSNNIRFVNNHIENSPAVGWNMGAITFLRINRGVIANNTIYSGNNGIYVRNACNGIQIANNVIDTPANYGIWMFDESIGSEILYGNAITGNTIKAGTDGINIYFSDRLTITGNVCNDPGRYGITIEQSNQTVINSNCVYSAAVKDILIKAGTTYITVAHNNGNCELTGSSSIYITFDIPSGFSFTDTTAPAAGYLSVIQRAGFGDGYGRHQFTTGGITVPAGWDANPLSFGNTNYVWVDGSGKLRIKTGVPTSDTDGTIVGTQT
jgi:hypothetical protein